LDHHYYAILIVVAITAGLLEHQNNVAAVAEAKLSIQSNIVCWEVIIVILFASVLSIINLYEIQEKRSIIIFNPKLQQHC
jgi:prolipoprotein diacylglyceryltransferase